MKLGVSYLSSCTPRDSKNISDVKPQAADIEKMSTGDSKKKR